MGPILRGALLCLGLGLFGFAMSGIAMMLTLYDGSYTINELARISVISTTQEAMIIGFVGGFGAALAILSRSKKP